MKKILSFMLLIIVFVLSFSLFTPKAFTDQDREMPNNMYDWISMCGVEFDGAQLDCIESMNDTYYIIELDNPDLLNHDYISLNDMDNMANGLLIANKPGDTEVRILNNKLGDEFYYFYKRNLSDIRYLVTFKIFINRYIITEMPGTNNLLKALEYFNSNEISVISNDDFIKLVSARQELLTDNAGGYQTGYANGYLDGDNNGYANGYKKGFSDGQASEFDGYTWLRALFGSNGIGALLSIELLPGITIGGIILIPISLSLIAFIIRIFKGGSSD